ncbi:MAG: nickel-responsive transcriptional regulator NikR [Candidatus Odinarchaeia archaeon]
MKQKFVRISMTIPTDLLEELEEVMKERKYNKRSEAIRDALRTFITENKWKYDVESKFIGALIFTYDHDTPGISDYLTHIQHKFHENIDVTMHIHLDKSRCLEVLAVKGNSEQLKKLSDSLSHKKGVEQSKLVLVK